MAGVVPAVTDLPGMSLIVDGEGVGVKAAPRDPDSIASAIRWLIEHPQEREEMAARARTLAETTYNWEVQSGRLLDLYERLT
jgi:glycosyltransferase involved in cell wall biosynthesis